MSKRWPATALLTVPIIASGCLGLGGFGNFDEGDFPQPTVLATYTQGSATLEVTQGDTTQTISLTRVGAGSTLVNIQGATVTWRNDDGWGLQVTTIDTSTMFGTRPSPSAGQTAQPTAPPYLGELAVMLIADHEYWRASNYGDESGNRCIVDLTEASASRVAGTATCRGLRWTDGTTAPMFFNQVYIEGQEPFDVEITFEATP